MARFGRNLGKFGQKLGEIWAKVIKISSNLISYGQNQNLASPEIRFPMATLSLHSQRKNKRLISSRCNN